MTWIGNLFIVLGLWFIGEKKRWAFIFSIVGEAVWVGCSLYRQMYDLAFICMVFLILAARSFYKWGK